jgi:hypothetical protein
LVDWGDEKRSKWTLRLEKSHERLRVVEQGSLETLGHKVWVRDIEYHKTLDRTKILLEESLKMGLMAA